MIEEKFELCPFCGIHVVRDTNFITGEPIDIVSHSENMDCPLFGISMSIEKWNTRPIEEQLRTKLAFLTTPVGSKWK